MIIAIDIDDVLTNTIEVTTAWFNEKFGTDFKIAEYKTPRYADVWHQAGIDPNEVFIDFTKSDAFKSISVTSEAKAAVEKLSQTHELHIITARIYELADYTKDWLEESLGGHYSSLTLTNHNYDQPLSQQVTKLDYCLKMGAKVIIEDNPDFILECAGEGIHAIVMPMPWNDLKVLDGHEFIHKVSGWQDVEAVIEKIAV